MNRRPAGFLLSCLFRVSLTVCWTPGFCDETSVPQQTPRSSTPRVFALTEARVVVSPQEILEPASLVIRDGRIVAVGDVDLPPDARVISMKGKSIYPGLIDAWSEQSVSSDRLSATARYWNGQVTPQISVMDQLPNVDEGGTFRRQGVVARLVAPADGIIRGRSALVFTDGGSANTSVPATDVAQHMSLTVTRRNRASYPGSPMGAVALARQAMYDAVWYRDVGTAIAADPALPRPEVNDALAALQPVISGHMPVIVTASNEQFVLRADQFAAEFGLRMIVRGSGREYRLLPEIAATGRPLILPVAFPKAPNVSTPEASRDVTLESLMHWDIAPENPARVAAAGIPFAFCSDQLDSKGNFLKFIRQAVERGLPSDAALRALTVTPSELFGVSDQLGTITPGKLASFVVTDGDLFSEKTRIAETWIAGKRFQTEPRRPRSASGTFLLKIEPREGHPSELYLDVSEADGRLRGQISTSPEFRKVAGDSESGTSVDTHTTQKLSELTLADSLLSAKFRDLTPNQSGFARFSLTLTDTESEAPDRLLGIGRMIWSDGLSATVRASRIAESSSPVEKESGDSDTPSETETPAPAPVPESEVAVSTDAEPAAAKTAASEGDASPSEETSDTKKSETVAADRQKTQSASFPVNYPLGAYGRTRLPEQSGLTAFVNATVWTCGPEGIIEDATLIIDAGRIVDAGRDVMIPENAQIIDLRGSHVTPGLIDCHSHAATDGGVNESTQAITCEVRIGDFIDANDMTIYRQLAGGVTGANILHGSANPIGGQNQVIKLRWGLPAEKLKFREAPPGVKFALGENVKQSNWSDANGRYPQTRMGVEQLYRDAFEAARDYDHRMTQWSRERRGLPPRRDLELDALREIVRGERWIHCHSYRQDEILALLRILEEYEITIGTFQHILEGYKVADEMARAGAMASAFSDWWAYKIEVFDAIPHAGAMMHKRGVVVSFNSDDGELARHLNQEAAKAIKYGGVSREEALKFVTLNPAKQLRIDHLVGSLEKGKHADFVVWSGDPLSNFSRCNQTWIDGTRYFDRNEDEQMRRETELQRNTLIQKILESGVPTRASGERDEDAADLWPRYDEFCNHFSHRQRQLQLLNEQQQTE